MDALSPLISVCYSDWLFYGESFPRLDVVHPGGVWSSSSACTWHCSLHYFLLQRLPCFIMSWPYYASFHGLTVSNTFIFTTVLLRTRSVVFAVRETHKIFLNPFIWKASRRVSLFFLTVQLSQSYVATGHTSASISRLHCNIKPFYLSKSIFMHLICSCHYPQRHWKLRDSRLSSIYRLKSHDFHLQNS